MRTRAFLSRIFSVILTFVHLDGVASYQADLEQAAQPPLPPLLGLGARQVRIVSEFVSSPADEAKRAARRLVEELVDWDWGRAALVSVDLATNLQRTLYQDARSGLAYDYWPHQCQVVRNTELVSKLDWLNGANLSEPIHRAALETGRLQEDERGQAAPREPRLEMFLGGVAGLWLEAERATWSRFEEVRMMYISSQDTYSDASIWLVRLEGRNSTMARFQFVQASQANGAGLARTELRLEQIELIQENGRAGSMEEQKVVKRMQIISLEQQIAAEQRAQHLEPPVGFGCLGKLKVSSPKGDQLQWASSLLRGPSQLELEVSARSHNSGAGRESSQPALVYVGLARAELRAKHSLQLMQVRGMSRGGQTSSKVVYNGLARVATKVDLLRGTCELEHWRDKGSRGQPNYEQTVVEFANGLRLDLVRCHSLLVGDSEDRFQLVKKSDSFNHATPPSERLYYEAELEPTGLIVPKEEAGSKLLRAVRVYSRETKSELRLESLTILVLNKDDKKLSSSFRLNILMARALDQGWPEIGRTFDVSDQCYLGAAEQLNRRYAWLEFQYSLEPSRLFGNQSEAELEQQVERIFHQKFTEQLLGGDPTRLPRVRAEIGGERRDAIFVRLLVLDSAPMQLASEPLGGQCLRAEWRDTSEFLPDVEHCARWCRLHQCQAMSFCQRASVCHTSAWGQRGQTARDEANSAAGPQFETNDQCNSWLLDPSLDSQQSLAQLVARLQQTSLAPCRAAKRPPELPQELELAAGESGLGEAQLDEMHAAYSEQLAQFMHNQCPGAQHMGHLLSLSVKLAQSGQTVHLLASNFAAEHDSLAELGQLLGYSGLADELLDSSVVSSFHKGAPSTRLKPVFEAKDEQGAAVLTQPLEGLTHDQCALACGDAHCGLFSYCPREHQCTLSSLSNIGQANSLQLAEPDPSCYLMERDFLASFTKFADVQLPVELRQSHRAAAGGASECAFECLRRSAAGRRHQACLSFEYCHNSRQNSLGTCFFQSQRHPSLLKASSSSSSCNQGYTNRTSWIEADPGERCHHYSRSRLADFLRLEYRSLAASQWARLASSEVRGLSALRCASMCADELAQCSGFQMCSRILEAQLERRCTFVLGQIGAGQREPSWEDEFQDALDEWSQLAESLSKWFDYDAQCQVFVLRRESLEAQVRHSAADELEARDGPRPGHRRPTSGQTLTLTKALLLYLGLALVSASVGCAFILIRDAPNLSVRSPMEALRVIFAACGHAFST